MTCAVGRRFSAQGEPASRILVRNGRALAQEYTFGNSYPFSKESASGQPSRMKILQVMARSYVEPAQMDATIAFYEHILGASCLLRIPIEPLGLEIAVVGAMHIVAGEEERLAPFRHIHAAFFVDSVIDFAEELTRCGAKILQHPEQGPNGLFMIVQHPDGTSVEYADNVVGQSYAGQ